MTARIYISRPHLHSGEPPICVERGMPTIERAYEVAIDGPSYVRYRRRGLNNRPEIKVWIEAESDDVKVAV